MGLFHAFRKDARVALIGVEAAGHGLETRPACRLAHRGAAGRAARQQDVPAAGRDRTDPRGAFDLGRPRLSGRGPEHAYLRDSGRATYVTATDDEAVAALQLLAETEGIIPALESAHAIAHVMRIAPQMKRSDVLLVCLSGRGDKDMATVASHLGVVLS